MIKAIWACAHLERHRFFIISRIAVAPMYKSVRSLRLAFGLCIRIRRILVNMAHAFVG
jgi:hypothetical protein